MLAGPNSGLTAVTSTPGEAAALAAAPIFTVIERVVLGLMTWMCIISLSSGRTGVFRRPSGSNQTKESGARSNTSAVYGADQGYQTSDSIHSHVRRFK